LLEVWSVTRKYAFNPLKVHFFASTFQSTKLQYIPLPSQNNASHFTIPCLPWLLRVCRGPSRLIPYRVRDLLPTKSISLPDFRRLRSILADVSCDRLLSVGVGTSESSS
jgi:hypothetical protein